MMKKIYEASNSIEAHMILNMIDQAGLSGRIDGEYLQGGAGELPAAGLVRVMVNESDYDVAKEIIVEWDARQPDSNETKPVKKGNYFSSGILGFISGSVLVAIFYNTPITNDGVDYNHDGVFDEKWTFVDGRMSKTELDRNLDGKVDFVYKYDRKGLLKSSKSDEYFDGKFETESHYYHGNIIWSESDTTGDGYKDYRMDFEYGVLDIITFFDPGTKKPLKIQKYNAFKLTSSEVDTNGDGVLDTVYKYDSIEEVVK